MGTNGTGNGGPEAKIDLVKHGAPTWYIVGYMHLDERITALEKATLETATKSGAAAGNEAGVRAGSKYGAFLGALLATAMSVGLSYCNHTPPPQKLPSSQGP